MKLALFSIGLVAWIVLAPLVFIWALSTLLDFQIPVTFTKWCAAFVLLSPITFKFKL